MYFYFASSWTDLNVSLNSFIFDRVLETITSLVYKYV